MTGHVPLCHVNYPGDLFVLASLMNTSSFFFKEDILFLVKEQISTFLHSFIVLFLSASPEWVTMSVSGDNQQPFAAGTKVTVTCSSGGGKPVPDFRWSLGGEEVEEHSETFGADLEAVSEISFVVEEEHDGQEILCW